MTTERLSAMTAKRIRVGVSTCLLGARARFDVGTSAAVTPTKCGAIILTSCRFIPRSPSVWARRANSSGRSGRRTTHASSVPADPKLDVTEALHGYGHEVAQQHQNLCGMIVKQGSPSCGLERVKIDALELMLQNAV